MPGAFKPPRPPKRLCGKTCVQDPSEASLGVFAFVCTGNVLQQIRLVEELGGERDS